VQAYRFLWSLKLLLWSLLPLLNILDLSRFFNRFLPLYHLLSYLWLRRNQFCSALTNWFFNDCFPLFYSFSLKLLNWRLAWCRRPYFLNRRLSLSDRWFHASLSLKAFHYFLKRKSWFLQIHFKFDGVLLRNVYSFLKPSNSFLFKISNVIGWIDINSSDIKFLVALFLSQFEIEKNFSGLVEIWKVKIKLASSEWHDIWTVSLNKVSVSHNFVLIKFLHSLI